MSSIWTYLFLIIFSTCYAHQVLSTPSTTTQTSGPNIPSGVCPTTTIIHNYINHIITFNTSISCHYVDVHLRHTTGELNYRMQNISTSTSYTKLIPSNINVTSYWFTYQTKAGIACDTAVYTVSIPTPTPTSTVSRTTPTPTTTPNIPSNLCPTTTFTHNYINHIITFTPSISCNYVDVHLRHTKGELNYRMDDTSTSTSYTKTIPSDIIITSYWFTYQTKAGIACDTAVYMVSIATAPPTPTPTPTATVSRTTPTPTSGPNSPSGLCPAMTFLHNYTNYIFTFNTSTPCNYVDVHLRHTTGELNYRMLSTYASTSYTKIIPSGITVTSYWFTYQTNAGTACDTAVYMVSIPTARPTPAVTVSSTTPTPTSGPNIPSGLCPAITFTHNYTNYIFTFNTSTSCNYVDVHLRHTNGELNYRMYYTSTSTSTSYTKTIPAGVNVTSYWFTYQTNAGTACDTAVYMVSMPTAPPTAPPTSIVSRPTTTPTSATMTFTHHYNNYTFTFNTSASCHYVDVHLRHSTGELNYSMSNTSTSTSTSYTKIIPSGINVTSYWFTYACDTAVYTISTPTTPSTPTPTPAVTVSSTTPTPTSAPNIPSGVCPAMTFTQNYTNHIITFNTSTPCNYVDVHLRHTKGELNYRMYYTSTSTSTSYTKTIPADVNVTSYWFTYQTNAGTACDTAVYMVSTATAPPTSAVSRTTPTPTPTPTTAPNLSSRVCPAMTFLHNYNNHIITFNTSTSCNYVDAHLRHTTGELNYRMPSTYASTSTSYTKIIPAGINVTSYWFTYQTSAGIACDTAVYMVSIPTPTPTPTPTSTVSRTTPTPTTGPNIPSGVCPSTTITHNYINHIMTFNTSISCNYVDVHLRHSTGELNYRMQNISTSTSTSYTKLIPSNINVTSYWFTYQTNAGIACDTNVYHVGTPHTTSSIIPSRNQRIKRRTQ